MMKVLMVNGSPHIKRTDKIITTENVLAPIIAIIIVSSSNSNSAITPAAMIPA